MAMAPVLGLTAAGSLGCLGFSGPLPSVPLRASHGLTGRNREEEGRPFIWGRRRPHPSSRSCQGVYHGVADFSASSTAVAATVLTAEGNQGVKKGRGGDAAETTTRNEWRVIAGLAAPETIRLSFGFCCLVLSAVLESRVPKYKSGFLNALLSSGTTGAAQAFKANMTGFVLVSIWSCALYQLTNLAFQLSSNRIIARLRRRVLCSLLGKEISFHEENRTGELISRLSSDAEKIDKVVSFHLHAVFFEGFKSLGCMYELVRMSRGLSAIILTGSVLCALANYRFGQVRRTLSRDIQTGLARASAVAQDALSNVRSVRLFDASEFELRRYDTKLDVSLRQQDGKSKYVARSKLGLNGLSTGLHVCLWCGAAQLIGRGEFPTSLLLTYFEYTKMVYGAVQRIGEKWVRIWDAMGSAEKVLGLVDVEGPTGALSRHDQGHTAAAAAAAAAAGGGGAVGTAEGTAADASEVLIRFHNCSFSYPTRRQVPVLTGLNLEVKRGEKVALVAPSGSGKSSIFALLCRLYDVDEGLVTLGGQDIRGIPKSVVSRRVCWVTSSPQLSSCSIRENITYGLDAKAFSESDLLSAATKARVHDFVCALPEGYGTLVGEKGVALSEGQKQRVALARAILRDPEILLLDEALNSLDQENMEAVRDAIESASAGRTTIMVSHQVPSVWTVDREVEL